VRVVNHYAKRVVLSLVRESQARLPGRTISTPLDAALLARSFIRDDPREHLIAIYLDTKHAPVGVHVVSIGSCSETSLAPRELFGPAMLCNAVGIVLAHNHPTGDPTPSTADEQSTQRMIEAGKLLGISVLDHVIIGADCYYAFSEGRKRNFPMMDS